MTDDLRIDLSIILLEECFKMAESHARSVVLQVGGAGDCRFKAADQKAYDAVDYALDRIVHYALGRQSVCFVVLNLAMSGIFDAAVYVIPSNGATAGQLVLSTKPLALEVVYFNGHGTRVSAISSMRLTGALWDACRRLPICPTE